MLLLVNRRRSFPYEQLHQQYLLVLYCGWQVRKLVGAHHRQTIRAKTQLMNGNGRTDETNVEVQSEERRPSSTWTGLNPAAGLGLPW
jgi:hypothetical protein